MIKALERRPQKGQEEVLKSHGGRDVRLGMQEFGSDERRDQVEKAADD